LKFIIVFFVGRRIPVGFVLPEDSESVPPPEKCLPKHRKVSRRRESASRSIGKSPAAGKVLPEGSESLPPPEKCFPKVRKVSRRRKSASRRFGKSPAAGKVFPESSENFPLLGKFFFSPLNIRFKTIQTFQDGLKV
jgi:hypothetical protein